jgi:uncharacterized protein YbbK (DUF523 family)
MKLVSACLLGINCRYDGENKYNGKVIAIYQKEGLIPVCPEQLGGMPTPRPPCGIYGDLNSQDLKVLAMGNGKDFTENFKRGAQEVLELAQRLGITEAILKQKSPSCGCGKTWQLDEKLENHLIEGDGILAALLKENGIKVISEEDL